ncbi:MAG TPA: FHA domain-containing protein [Kofleriaceae bacterium]|nr:FHA domain-containing protein [Kofleriaceae bacterium]
MLCRACAETIPACDGLLPDHVVGTVARDEAGAWLIDPWGVPHALRRSRTTVGRRSEADLTVLSASVSRDHAELGASEGGWVVRDLGSRNGTEVDGVRVQGRAPLADGARLRFGEANFIVRTAEVAMPSIDDRSLETVQASPASSIRYGIRHGETELVLLGSVGEDVTGGAAGALLYRRGGAGGWFEVTLPPLEFRLLEALCAQHVAEGDSPARARGCVATKQLARILPFQSRYANEENVRQVVRRVRSTLKKLDLDGVVDSIPGRGYYVAWPVSRA